MTAPEPTPLERAAEAVRNMVADDAEVQAQEIVTALLAGDWLERVLAEHRGPRRRLLVGGVPDWICDDCLVSIARANESVDRAMARHQAAAIRAAAGVGL